MRLGHCISLPESVWLQHSDRSQGDPLPVAGMRAQRTGLDGRRAGNARRPRSWSV